MRQAFLMDITFFPLRDDHLQEVLAIEQSSFPEPWSRAMFEREISLPISHFYVARSEDMIAGYGGYWKVADEAHLVSLAVHPELRSRGYGRKILRYLTAGMRESGSGVILLEVRKSNLAAQRLYASEGFREIGSRQKYYGNEDAIVMEKKLDTAAGKVPGDGKVQI